LLVLGAARSGWRRGLVFYVIDLVGFVASVLLAIRFHSYPAVFWELMGWSQRWAAFLGGLVIFIPLIVLTAWLGSRAAKAVYKPGLFTLNRILGAAVASALAVAMALVGLLFLRAAPLPFGIGNFVKGSAIAEPAIEAAEPVIGALDDTLGLDLCGGRLKRIINEVCRPG
jgi:uncharacterized membrane protein required for colicin V production